MTLKMTVIKLGNGDSIETTDEEVIRTANEAIIRMAEGRDMHTRMLASNEAAHAAALKTKEAEYLADEDERRDKYRQERLEKISTFFTRLLITDPYWIWILAVIGVTTIFLYMMHTFHVHNMAAPERAISCATACSSDVVRKVDACECQ